MTVTVAAAIIIESDDALVHLSRDNPGYRIEREEDGSITMSPTDTKRGAKSLKAGVQLDRYASTVGGKAFDSSTGFNVGPRKKTMSPNASWISQSRIDELIKLGKAEKYWPISPDVIIEVKSDTDDFMTASRLRRRGQSVLCPPQAALRPASSNVSICCVTKRQADEPRISRISNG